MTINEVRAIREKTSIETIGMNTEELRKYFAQGATDIERRIANIRKERGIVFKPPNNNNTNKSMKKKEHGNIYNNECFANLAKTNTNVNTGQGISVHELTENYDSNN